ncbi:MAG: phage holin family protein [Thermoanaerobaculia bacterium]
MLRLLAHVIINGLGIWLIAWLVPGIHYQGGVWYLLLTGLVIGLLNVLVKPVVTVLSLPLILLTLGLFYLAINGILLYLAGWLLDGLTVDGCGAAFLGGVVMGFYNWVTGALLFNRK